MNFTGTPSYPLYGSHRNLNINKYIPGTRYRFLQEFAYVLVTCPGYTEYFVRPGIIYRFILGTNHSNFN